MLCNQCQSDTHVIESRTSDHQIRRRRECNQCGLRFTTYEARAIESTQSARPPEPKVPVAPLLAAFVKSDESWTTVTRRLGWMRPDGRPDVSRLRRALGSMPYHSRGRTRLTQNIEYDLAVKLADAIGVDPVDVGI